MIKVATQINSFAHVAKQANVPPEEPIFVLSGSQLQDVISKAILEATQPLIESIEVLEARVTRQNKLINDLRKKEPSKMEISRATKIERYLQARPDHRATFETLKGYLGIDKHRLREAIRTLMKSSPERYGISRTLGDKRKLILVMLPR